MTVCRIRLTRDSPATGAYEWAVLEDNGTVLETGTAPLRPPPANQCELLIASELVQLARIPVPAAQQRRISSALRYLVEDIAIADPERLHVAAASMQARDAVHVGIVDRQWMTQMLARLKLAGLAAGFAGPECLLPELPERAWTVIWNGAESFARTGEFQGFSLDLPGEGDAPVALRLALEEARALDSAPARIVVRTAAGTTAPALDQWTAALGVPVEAGAIWDWPGARHQPRLNLLQGEFAPRTGEREWTRALRRPALLAGALAIVGTAGVALDWRIKATERNALTAQMQQIFRTAFGDNAVVVDAPLQMSRALAQLRRQAGQIADDDFLALLGAVSAPLLDPAKLRVDSIAYANGRLTLTVRPNDASQFSTLLGEMRAKSSIPGLDVKLEPAESAGRISLLATAAPPGGR